MENFVGIKMARLYVPIIVNEQLEESHCNLFSVVSHKHEITNYYDSDFNGWSYTYLDKKLKLSFPAETFSFDIYECDKDPEFGVFENFSENTASISLGLFCSAYAVINNRKYKENYDSITITGDFQIYDGIIQLSDVIFVKEKFDAAKKYANNHADKNHLFLYISSKEIVPEGLHDDNLLVVRYDSTFPIECVFAEIFEGAYTEEQEKELIRFRIKEIENEFFQTKGAISWKKQILNPNINGLVIKGSTNTGKTITTKFLCKWLIDTNCVDDFLWITVSNNLEFYKILQETQNEIYFNTKNKKIDGVEKYYSKGFSKFDALLKARKRSLVIIDNIEGEYIDEIINYFSSKYSLYLKDIKFIISSWHSCRKKTSLCKLNLIEKDISEVLPSDNDFPLLVKKIINTSDFKTGYELLTETQQKEIIDVLYPICKNVPGLISVALSSITNKTLARWFQDIKAIDTIENNNDVKGSLFQLSLETLDFFSQIVLFACLGINDFDSDINILSYKKIIKKKILKNKIDISENILYSSFEELVKHSMLQINDKKIAIKNDALIYFAFSKKISSELQTVRNALIDKGELIEFAMSNCLYNEFLKIISTYKNKDDFSYALLIAARINADIQFFKTLIEQGADVNYINKGNEANLAWFVYRYCNKLEVLKYLIKNDMDYNKGVRGVSPLFALARNDSDEIFNYVIDNHLYETIEAKCREYTLLFYVLASGNLNRVKKLFSINAKFSEKGRKGETILHMALISANNNLLQFIFDKNLCKDINVKTTEKLSSLEYATINDNLLGFQILLQKGADLTICIDDVIDVALRTNSEKIIRYILESNLCNISDRLEINLMNDGYKRNYLAYYVEICDIFNMNIFNILWEASTKGAVRELTENTILIHSFHNENTSVPAQYLLINHYYADLNKKESFTQERPLQIAVQKMPVDIIKMLLEK
jgi:ankyrin repeat protein